MARLVTPVTLLYLISMATVLRGRLTVIGGSTLIGLGRIIPLLATRTHYRSPTCPTLAKINRTVMSCYLVPRVCEDPMLREFGLNLDLESGRVLGY